MTDMENEPGHPATAPESGALLLHRLYVASRRGEPFTRAERSTVIDAVAACSDGFTLSDALGYFRGRPIATLVIDIASADTSSVRELASILRRLLGQKEVGLAVGGEFHTIKA